MSVLLGRTNLRVEQTWYSLQIPSDNRDTEKLAERTFQSGHPVDLTAGKSVWGPHIKDSSSLLVFFGDDGFTKCRNRSDACDVVSSQIVEVLSSLLGKTIGLFFLPVARVVDAHCWEGAIEAVETARNDGLVSFSGLSCLGPGMAALLEWTYRDAFDVLCLHSKDQEDTLLPMANDRRTGVVTTYSSTVPDACVLKIVRRLEDLEKVGPLSR